MDEAIEALLLAVPGERPEGTFDEDHALYQSIEQEMVKVGSLRAATIDWTLVENASRQYLREECKHFRVVTHLCAAWWRRESWRDWLASLELVTGMAERYWATAHPNAGARGMQAKRRQWGTLVERLGGALKALPPAGYDDALQARAKTALERLERAETEHGLTPASAARLREALAHRVEPARRAPYEPARPEAHLAASHDAVGPGFFTSRSDSPIGDERETRRLYLRIADYINQQDAYEPTGYLLRRHALWSQIHGTPPVKRERRTELMNVPDGIATEYRDMIASGALSPALLLRIEKSVSASPYWLRGSFYAATVAQRLEMPTVAMVIRTAVERFVRRLPTLRDLAFSDGAPFLDDETFDWVSGMRDTTPRGATATLAGLQGELQSEQLAGQGVEAMLRHLQSMQTTASPPRDRHLASIAAADVLDARGLTWLARDLYAGVAEEMRRRTASEWEPDVFDYVRARGNHEAGSPPPEGR